MSERIIVACEIGPYPQSHFDPRPKVAVTYDDGIRETLFFFYSDELAFREHEFIGLNREQALAVRQRKDVAYLQS